MSDTKLDQILATTTRVEERLIHLEGDVSVLKGDVSVLKGDVSVLKGDVSVLKGDVSVLVKRQDEMLAAFRTNGSDIASLYRAVREDLHRFEERVEAKLSQVAQAIQALRDSLERQDFRADELARRISRLEVGDEPPL